MNNNNTNNNDNNNNDNNDNDNNNNNDNNDNDNNNNNDNNDNNDNNNDNNDNIYNTTCLKKNIKQKSKKNLKQNIKQYYCYILRNRYEQDKNRTYNGYTVDPIHRLRQHNQEIKGGAIYTKTWGNKTWNMYCLIKGFPNKRSALQCEWKIKHPARKKLRPAKYNSPEGRIIGLNEIFQLDKFTSECEYLIKDMNLEIFIVKEYANKLTNVPSNILVHIVDSLNLDEIV
jgi:predicted GIY-YIG superfamily endonuclease